MLQNAPVSCSQHKPELVSTSAQILGRYKLSGESIFYIWNYLERFNDGRVVRFMYFYKCSTVSSGRVDCTALHNIASLKPGYSNIGSWDYACIIFAHCIVWWITTQVICPVTLVCTGVNFHFDFKESGIREVDSVSIRLVHFIKVKSSLFRSLEICVIQCLVIMSVIACIVHQVQVKVVV